MYNNNGYGGLAYYTSETCGYINKRWVFTGCTTDYAQSDIKYAVDAWNAAKAPAAIEARLITYDDLTDNLGYEKKNQGTINSSSSGATPSWLHDFNYYYWTMSPYDNSASVVRHVGFSGSLNFENVNDYHPVVRPVITIFKSSI